MSTPERVTRADLKRKLAVNAATKPLNIAVLGGLLAVGLLLHLLVIVGPIALAAYLALAGQTFFDAEEAKKVADAAYGKLRANPAPALESSTLAPQIRAPLDQARQTAASIHAAIDQADAGMEDVRADVDALVSAMETSARRANLIASTLSEQARSGQDADSLASQIENLRPRAGDADVRALISDLTAQRDATVRLAGKLDRFQVGMQRICASLGLLRTRIVEMSASEEEAAQRALAQQSKELRERTDLLAESMAEVFAADPADPLAELVDLPVATDPAQALAQRKNSAHGDPSWM